jgi:RNA polymerase sigma-70 factor (ECF subfamily)
MVIDKTAANPDVDEQERYRWLATHILPHEQGVRQWLRRHVHTLSPGDIDNIVLEAYACIWAAKDFSRIVSGRRYFHFVVQDLLLKHARRARVVPVERMREIDALRNGVDQILPDPRIGARREVDRLFAIVAEMPAKCRRAFQLQKLDGLSLRDTAWRMRTTPRIVQKHLAKALALITAAMGSQADPVADNGAIPGVDRRDTAGRRE